MVFLALVKFPYSIYHEFNLTKDLLKQFPQNLTQHTSWVKFIDNYYLSFALSSKLLPKSCCRKKSQKFDSNTHQNWKIMKGFVQLIKEKCSIQDFIQNSMHIDVFKKLLFKRRHSALIPIV